MDFWNPSDFFSDIFQNKNYRKQRQKGNFWNVSDMFQWLLEKFGIAATIYSDFLKTPVEVKKYPTPNLLIATQKSGHNDNSSVEVVYLYIYRERPLPLSKGQKASAPFNNRCNQRRLWNTLFSGLLVHYYSRNMAAQNIALSIAHKTIVYGSKQTFLTALTGLHGR